MAAMLWNEVGVEEEQDEEEEEEVDAPLKGTRGLQLLAGICCSCRRTHTHTPSGCVGL